MIARVARHGGDQKRYDSSPRLEIQAWPLAADHEWSWIVTLGGSATAPLTMLIQLDFLAAKLPGVSTRVGVAEKDP